MTPRLQVPSRRRILRQMARCMVNSHYFTKNDLRKQNKEIPVPRPVRQADVSRRVILHSGTPAGIPTWLGQDSRRKARMHGEGLS